ncbi:Nucleotide-binding, alpha-beta plait [Ostreococcus tauri]|uniref:Nucleotide-binding, alpha-beta plait n=1 Tax=Ostreococcus tauri TaxID=70448 RepID=Q00UG3_OSTTA|nr:Nucleotide-binding, alpha-beta plait [Ostreococcus tauri]OUS44245.1 putative RNA binding protein [Ostreococcus tauri]CAL58086.1 Nucleotide-binding, alpha-beta plait [Ostreococcus tauri]|eukprot:XP_003083537.1 Nucleotide-binding, alpha-beta plait [Ostreococcus tauri]
MTSTSSRQLTSRLPPEVNRILYVRNLPFNVTSEDMHEIFGKFGALRQIRLGSQKNTKGTAYVVYEDIWDAKTACEHLSGFNVANRYLIVMYHQSARMRESVEKKREETRRLQETHGVTGDQR